LSAPEGAFVLPGSLRAGLLAAAILLAVLWLAPALLLPRILTRLAEAEGFGLELEGVRPALPFGVAVERAVVMRGGAKIEITPLAARMLLSGLRLEGSIGRGTVLLRTDGLTLRGGLIRVQSFPLERLDSVVTGAFKLRGSADGVYRFGTRETVEATLSRGALILRAPVAMELPFAQLVISAGREDDGTWRVDFADLRGPPLSGSARGQIGAQGQLALRVEISQLDELARTAFSMAHLPTGPLPYSAELGGTIANPSFARLPAEVP
jgi:hypothetical protein